jgi:hypothetical protein
MFVVQKIGVWRAIKVSLSCTNFFVSNAVLM